MSPAKDPGEEGLQRRSETSAHTAVLSVRCLGSKVATGGAPIEAQKAVCHQAAVCWWRRRSVSTPGDWPEMARRCCSCNVLYPAGLCGSWGCVMYEPGESVLETEAAVNKNSYDKGESKWGYHRASCSRAAACFKHAGAAGFENARPRMEVCARQNWKSGAVRSRSARQALCSMQVEKAGGHSVEKPAPTDVQRELEHRDTNSSGEQSRSRQRSTDSTVQGYCAFL